MKIEYSADIDALYVYFQEVEVATSAEPDDGILVDLDDQGEVVGIEFLDASERFESADAALMLVDGGPNYTKANAKRIRSILSHHTRVASLIQDDVD